MVIKYRSSRWCRRCSLPVTVCQEIPVDDDLLSRSIRPRYAASPCVPIYVRMDYSTIDRRFPGVDLSDCSFFCRVRFSSPFFHNFIYSFFNLQLYALYSKNWRISFSFFIDELHKFLYLLATVYNDKVRNL